MIIAKIKIVLTLLITIICFFLKNYYLRFRNLPYVLKLKKKIIWMVWAHFLVLIIKEMMFYPFIWMGQLFFKKGRRTQ